MTSAPVSYSQITYDPSSSAGKQYEIPVDAVRQQVGGASVTDRAAAPGTTASAGKAAGAPDASLFGQGIKPVASQGKSRSGTRPNGSSSAGAAGKGTSSAQGVAHLVAPDAVVRAAERSARDPMTGSTGTSWWLYALVGVLGCAFLTVVLRRGTSGGSPPAQA